MPEPARDRQQVSQRVHGRQPRPAPFGIIAETRLPIILTAADLIARSRSSSALLTSNLLLVHQCRHPASVPGPIDGPGHRHPQLASAGIPEACQEGHQRLMHRNRLSEGLYGQDAGRPLRWLTHYYLFAFELIGVLLSC